MSQNSSALRVLHVCAEVFPLLKTGGLADVTAALPPALEKQGCEVRMLVPGFPAFVHGIQDQHLVTELPARFGARKIRLMYGKMPGTGVPVYYVDAPDLYDRPGNPYNDKDGQPYHDNHLRFALLGWCAARLVEGFDYFWKPDIVHGHDWHAGLAFAYIKALEWHTGKRTVGTVFTVHNMAYQGNFPAYMFSELDLPFSMFNADGIEFYGQVSFLKSGFYYADKVTTVSPTYAREIRYGEQSCGLGGVVQQREADLVGILNGVDTGTWNPRTDKRIEANYHVRAMTGKKKCRLALQKEMGLTAQNDKPVFCVVSRFAAQKGLHLVVEGINTIVGNGGQVVVMGNGEHWLEDAFLHFERTFPGQVAVRIGYDEDRAHRVFAGSDVVMVPSRYEPCGLVQMYGSLYGTLPLVHRVGGLADTVVDCSLENLAEDRATGFCFDHFDYPSFESAVHRAFALFGKQTHWKKVQKRGMKLSFGWENPAAQYVALYQLIRVVA